MALSIVGAVGSFDPTTNQWVSYIEQMEFFLANDIKEDRKKVAALISTNVRVTKRLVLAR